MELTSITTSYSRKLNHALYGGGNYESSDHFMSLSAELEADENVLEAHEQLKTACEEMVNSAVEDEITLFSGGTSAEDFYTFLRDMVAGRKIDPNFYEECNKRQKAVLQAAKRGLQMKLRDKQKHE